MKSKNLKWITILTSMMVLSAFSGIQASDKVEWEVHETLKLEAKPIDVAITYNGRKIFVLTDKGEILVYASGTTPEATIEVGKHVDQIRLGPRGDTLILSSGKNKTVEVITIDFIQTINISGSPFKGPEDAPVVIAVFDDFQ